MTREIKFRMWDKEFGTMKYVDDCQHYFKCDFYHYMQYTGLKDKNGKEIYEGDIVSVMGGEYLGVIKWVERMGECNVFGDGELIIGLCVENINRDEKDYKLHRHYPSGAEIIGNIYETPELLGER